MTFDELPALPLTVPSRREFLGALAGVLAVAPRDARHAVARARGHPCPPARPQTGASVSIVGYGGWDCVIGDEPGGLHRPPARGDRRRHHLLDNAWEYHDGRAEELMGRALDRPRGATRSS